LLPQRVTASPGWVSVKVLRTRLLQPERTASGRMYTEMGHLRCRMTSYGQGPCPFVGSGAVRAPAREREVPRCTSQGDACAVGFLHSEGMSFRALRTRAATACETRVRLALCKKRTPPGRASGHRFRTGTQTPHKRNPSETAPNFINSLVQCEAGLTIQSRQPDTSSA